MNFLDGWQDSGVQFSAVDRHSGESSKLVWREAQDLGLCPGRPWPWPWIYADPLTFPNAFWLGPSWLSLVRAGLAEKKDSQEVRRSLAFCCLNEGLSFIVVQASSVAPAGFPLLILKVSAHSPLPKCFLPQGPGSDLAGAGKKWIPAKKLPDKVWGRAILYILHVPLK